MESSLSSGYKSRNQQLYKRRNKEKGQTSSPKPEFIYPSTIIGASEIRKKWPNKRNGIFLPLFKPGKNLEKILSSN